MAKQRNEMTTTPHYHEGNTQLAANPFGQPMQGGGALAAIIGNAEVVKEMSSIYIAKQFPRNVDAVIAEVSAACSRKELASLAQYSYPRGNETVTGPSIRLAEVILAAWGNCESGWRELGRHRDKAKGLMVSECEAFAFDKEKNVIRKISFEVTHVRNTKNGSYALTDERDIYELCANMSSRRIRSCILQIVPGWLVEMAVMLCNQTMRDDNVGNLKGRIADMMAKFDEIGISVEMIERKIQRSVDDITNKDIVSLGRLYNSIKDGFVTRASVFGADAEAAADAPEVRKSTLFDKQEDEQDDIPMGNDMPSFGTAV